MSYPYYRFFPGDYLRDTRRLTLLQHGAYHLLLHEYMASGKPLRGEVAAMCRICGALSGEEQMAVEFVLTEFFVRDGPNWRHKRCDAELAKLADRSDKATESINKRWQRERDTNVLRTNNEGNTNQNQNQNQEPKPPKGRTERVAAKAPPRKRLPDDWKLPKDWGEWALAERKDWTPDYVRKVAAMFADHWRSKAEARADWLATWRNWVRNDRGNGLPARETQADKRAKVAAQMYAHRTKEVDDDAIDGIAKRLD